MADLKPFFDIVRLKFGPLNQGQVDGITTLLNLSAGLPLPHRAYILATAWHETARTMQPITEIGKGKGRLYGVPAGPYKQIYYGRGYVQLTWLQNYQKAAQIAGQDLVQYPDLALRPDIAGQIAISGMTGGWFTGKKLSDYSDYVGMRHVINGTDQASLIAGYAQHFETALKEVPIADSDPAPSPSPDQPPAVQSASQGGL